MWENHNGRITTDFFCFYQTNLDVNGIWHGVSLIYVQEVLFRQTSPFIIIGVSKRKSTVQDSREIVQNLVKILKVKTTIHSFWQPKSKSDEFVF